MILNTQKKIILVIILAFFLLAGIYLYSIGDFLVEEDFPKECDIIVVLMGSIPDRILGACDLYQKGYGQKIVLVETHKIGYNILEERNINVTIEENLNKYIAIKSGVIEDDIVIIPGDTKSTQDEAICVRDYLNKNDEIGSLILVTSKYHSMRSKRIFEKALNKLNRKIEIISCPTEYDDFNEKAWWTDREDIEKVVFETIKFINYYIREQFELN